MTARADTPLRNAAPAARATRLAALVPILAGVVWAGGCHEDRVVGPLPNLSIQKPASNSGDEQSDTVLTTLASPLRVLVLRDGVPCAGRRGVLVGARRPGVRLGEHDYDERPTPTAIL